MYLFTPKKYFRVFVSVCVVVTLLITPVTYTGNKNEVNAGGALAGLTFVKDIENTIQNTLQALSLAALEQKELVLDGIFFNLAQKALQKMTGDIITWLNSGFNGEPAFITDVIAYLDEGSNTVANEFFHDAEIRDALCEPFTDEVRTTLKNIHIEQATGGVADEVQCTLDTTTATAFLSGSFSAGGWEAWFEVLANPENTALGAALRLDLEKKTLIQQKRDAQAREADYGRGIRSIKTCEDASRNIGCVITNPGALMQDLASKALGTGIDSLLQADEMNEAIGALFSNLSTQVLQGANGLLGLGGNANFTASVSGSTSYLDLMQEEANSATVSALNQNPLKRAMQAEVDIIETGQKITAQINVLVKEFADANLPYAGNSCWNLKIPTVLDELLSEVSLNMQNSASTLATLIPLSTQFDATTKIEDQQAILSTFQGLSVQNLLQGPTVKVRLQGYLSTELPLLSNTFRKEIAAAVAGCS